MPLRLLKAFLLQESGPGVRLEGADGEEMQAIYWFLSTLLLTLVPDTACDSLLTFQLPDLLRASQAPRCIWAYLPVSPLAHSARFYISP